jgi:proteasome lid subunit RPN8/RPN11
MFGAKVEADARQHALEQYPHEAVGAVVGTEYIPLENVSEEPEVAFRLETYPSDAEAIIHSHTRGRALEPSSVDMIGQQGDGRPWGITLCNGQTTKGIQWFGDQVPIDPYVGRTWINGVNDCWSLIRDIYRFELGIHTLPDLPRDADWSKGSNPPDLLSDEEVRKAGFYRIERKELRIWDVMLASIGARVTNHCGVYVGGNFILHHTATNLSSRALLNPWEKRIRHYLRHRDLKDVSEADLPTIKDVFQK